MLTFGDFSSNLENEEVNALHERVTMRLINELGVEIR